MRTINCVSDLELSGRIDTKWLCNHWAEYIDSGFKLADEIHGLIMFSNALPKTVHDDLVALEELAHERMNSK